MTAPVPPPRCDRCGAAHAGASCGPTREPTPTDGLAGVMAWLRGSEVGAEDVADACLVRVFLRERDWDVVRGPVDGDADQRAVMLASGLASARGRGSAAARDMAEARRLCDGLRASGWDVAREGEGE